MLRRAKRITLVIKNGLFYKFIINCCYDGCVKKLLQVLGFSFMKWNRLGRIFDPSMFGSFSSHAQVPTPFVLEDKIRVFYAARFKSGKSFTTYVDLELNNPNQIRYIHKEPIMGFGEPGTFDDDGVMPSYVLENNKELWLYYSGWNQKVSTPYHNSTGLAVSKDGGNSFQRKFEGPVLDRTPLEPYLAVTPTIIKEPDHFKMWYISGIRWEKVNDKFEPVYVIKYAHSKDGIEWKRPNLQVIPSRHELEAFSRPTVFKLNGLYHMHFCFRGSHDYRDGSQAYKFGYAISEDGIKWNRNDEGFSLVGEKGDWESTMNCYPFYFETKTDKYMLYNGNGFGQSGFGILKLEK